MKRKFVSGLAILFLVTGCVSLSNQENKNGKQQTIQTKIVEGSTTKEQVLMALGKATTISFSDVGDELWAYSYIQSSSKLQDFIPIVKFFVQGSYLNPLQLVIVFDKKCIVSKYTIHKDVLHGID
ncbi:MAG: hypothetical protein NVS3B3_09500 [Aquirhabdus sp.]